MRNKYLLVLLNLLLIIGNLYSQDSLYFYSNGDIIFRAKKTDIDSLSFLDTNSQFQDSVYIMVSGQVLFKEAMTKIDSLTFSNANINFVYQALAQDSRFSIFSEALVLTGLNEKLNKIEDESYEISSEDAFYIGAFNTKKIPPSRKYEYTILAESDSVYNLYGINNINDLIDYAQSHYYNPNSLTPSDPDMSIVDYKDSMNFFNQFMSYHLLDRKIAPGKFIDDYDKTGHQFQGDAKYDMEEYLETMRENTIIEVRTDKANGRSNLINWDMNSDSGIKIVSIDSPNKADNGYYYEIDGILTYNELFYSNISSKRLRIDVASIFPELMNNGLRNEGFPNNYLLSAGFLEKVTVSEPTKFSYYPPDNRFEDFQGDEFWISAIGLKSFDIIIETPPIPSGIYEVRMGYVVLNSSDSIQMYFDEDSLRIVDFSVFSTDSTIGYVVPGTDESDPYGYENDKVLRSNGYMKAPACYHL